MPLSITRSLISRRRMNLFSLISIFPMDRCCDQIPTEAAAATVAAASKTAAAASAGRVVISSGVSSGR